MHDSGMYDILHIFGEGNEVKILKTRYPPQEGERVGRGPSGLVGHCGEGLEWKKISKKIRRVLVGGSPNASRM